MPHHLRKNDADLALLKSKAELAKSKENGGYSGAIFLNDLSHLNKQELKQTGSASSFKRKIKHT